MTTLAERIKECLDGPPRKTQKALADACGIEAPSVNDWVSGKTKSINAEHLFPAAEFLGVEPYWLATGKGKKYKSDNSNQIPENAAQAEPEHEIRIMLKEVIDELKDEELTLDRVELLKEAAKTKKENIPQSTDVLFVINHPRPEYKITKEHRRKRAKANS